MLILVFHEDDGFENEKDWKFSFLIAEQLTCHEEILKSEHGAPKLRREN